MASNISFRDSSMDGHRLESKLRRLVKISVEKESCYISLGRVPYHSDIIILMSISKVRKKFCADALLNQAISSHNYCHQLIYSNNYQETIGNPKVIIHASYALGRELKLKIIRSPQFLRF